MSASIARPLWWCLALLVLFTLPIVLHTVVEWPGEIRKYVAYGRNNGSNRHGLVESARFVASYWPGSGAASALLALMIVGARSCSPCATQSPR